MSLSSGGLLSGTPLSGSSIFTVTATDTNGCKTSAIYTLVLANDCPPITVTPTSLPNATAGQPYNQTLVASVECRHIRSRSIAERFLRD